MNLPVHQRSDFLWPACTLQALHCQACANAARSAGRGRAPPAGLMQLLWSLANSERQVGRAGLFPFGANIVAGFGFAITSVPEDLGSCSLHFLSRPKHVLPWHAGSQLNGSEKELSSG